jgi:hypothetical protein
MRAVMRILKQRSRSLSRHTSVLDSFKAYSGTRAPPPVVLGSEANDTDDRPQFKRECPLLKFVICLSVHVFSEFFMIRNMSLLLGQNRLSFATNVASLGTTHDLSSADDGILHS